eukprot:scaffold705_cov119-Isochrysis_galbana.AAC.3
MGQAHHRSGWPLMLTPFGCLCDLALCICLCVAFPFFLLSSPPPPAGPVAVWTDGRWMGAGCKGCRPPDTTTCSGLARFQCTLPPPALCTKAPPFFFCPPFPPLPACGLMDGGRMQRVAAPQTPLYVFWLGTVPMHTPTHSSTTCLATHPPTQAPTTGLATHPPASPRRRRPTDARQTTFHTPQPNWGVAPGWPTRHLQKRQLHVRVGGVRKVHGVAAVREAVVTSDGHGGGGR